MVLCIISHPSYVGNDISLQKPCSIVLSKGVHFFSEIWKIRRHGYVPSETETVTMSAANGTVSADSFNHINDQ